MNYKISVERTFSAAHAIRGYQGKCERMHGHTWKVRVTLSGTKLNKLGMLMDFTELKAVLGSVIDRLDHHNINEVPPFTKTNPTAENIAGYIYHELVLQFRTLSIKLKISAVEVWESESSSATVLP